MARKPPPLPKTAEFTRATDAAFEEVYANVPKSVVATGKTGAAKRSMMAAVAMSKARRSMRG